MSGVQSAIALEALVSAAFILISSKVGDLIGRKRAYVIGLLAYAVGALAMTLAQNLTAIIIFWAIIGGLGASLLLPAMQSLIHGNFEGAARKQAYALVGAAAAIAAAVGPLLGGFVTTYLSWRVGFGLEVVVIAVVLSQIKLVKDVPYTGSRQIDFVGAVLSVLGMGGLVLGILVWQEGGEAVGLLMAIGAAALALLAYWLVRRKREGKVTLIDPDLFRFPHFRIGISQQMMQQITLGGAMIALPIFLQMTLEYNAMQAGLSLAPLSLSMFGVALLAGKKAGKRRPSNIVLRRVCAHLDRDRGDHPDRSSHRYRLGAGRPAADHRLGPRPPGVAAEQLHAVADRGGAGQRGGRRQLRRRVVRALVRIGDGRRAHARVPLLRLHQAGQREPCDPACAAAADLQRARARRRGDEQRSAGAAAQSGAGGCPGGDPSHQQEARDRSLQVALLVPLLAGLIGIFNAFRMNASPIRYRRAPPKASRSVARAQDPSPGRPRAVVAADDSGPAARRSSTVARYHEVTVRVADGYRHRRAVKI